MNQSENIIDLVQALIKVQSEELSAKKDSTNPFFKSKYADLSSVWDISRQVLHKNGLCIMQCGEVINDKPMLVTILAHSSGQWIRSYLPLNPAKNDPQGLGSAITYMRRYGLSAIIGVVADDDDDGEAATRRDDNQKKRDDHVNKKPNTTLVQSVQFIDDIQAHAVREKANALSMEMSFKFYDTLKSKGMKTIEEIPVDKLAGILTWIDILINEQNKGK